MNGVEQALEIARRMASAGIPLFLAPPDDSPVGFRFPTGWQRTEADPSVVDQWREGWALCAVGGHGIDFVDIDPRNGGAESYASLNGTAPRAYGWTSTPSEGFHSFVHNLGVRSLNGAYLGVDVKAGDDAGVGRGFVFLPPTVRASKVDGVVRPYTWFQALDLEKWALDQGKDQSGAGLAEHVRRRHAEKSGGVAGGGLNAGALEELSPILRAFFTQRAPQSASAASRAIIRKLEEVAYWRVDSGAGFRDVLMGASFTLGGYVGGGFIEREHAYDRLCGAVSVYWGSPDADDLKWISDGLDDGAGAAFEVYADEPERGVIGAPGDTGNNPPPSLGSLIGDWAFDPTGDGSDQGFAHAALARMYPVVRYAPDSGQWLTRENWKWVADQGDASGWVVSTLADMMPLGETPVPKDTSLRTERHWQAVRRAKFVTSSSASGVERKMRTLVSRSGHASTVRVEYLDADPEILWADGVPYDLRASLSAPVAASLDPHTPHLHNALCRPELQDTPLWDAFLEAVWPDEAERSWALRVLSISLTGYADAALPVLWGDERNGKTSIVEFLLDVLGTYGITADPKLLAGVDSAHASIVYALKGARLAFVDEGPRRGHLATERLKQLTGGGRLTGNAMRANPVTFKTTHTLIMTSNDAPPMTDPALRARIRAIHCGGDKVQVRAAREALTPEVWRREAPGVLWKMIIEAAAWLADRSSTLSENAPASFRETEEEVAASQDPTREWVTDCTVPSEPGTPGRALYRSFCSWHEGQAMYRKAAVPTENAFGRTLTDMGYPWTKIGRGIERLKYRPLSVFGGPPSASPSAPPSGSSVGTVDRTIGDTSGEHMSPPQNPSSDTVYRSFRDIGDISNINTAEESHTYTQKEVYSSRKNNMGKGSSAPPGVDHSTSVDQPQEVGTSEGPQNVPKKVVKPNLTVGVQVSGGLTQEAQKVAQRSDQEGIPKAEARAALKAERLATAAISAQGPLTELPAAVDRSGAVIAITEEFAATLLGQCSVLTVDVETTGYPIGHRDYRLKTVQLGNSSVAVVLDPVAHAEPIKAALVRATVLHAHSAVADLVPLAVAGLIDYSVGWEKMFDTVIPAKLGDPQSTGSDPGLKKLASAVLRETATAPGADTGREALFKAGGWLTRVKPEHDVSRSGWARCDPRSEVMLRYAASDVLDTAALATRLPAVPEKIMERERLAEAMVSQVSYRGIRIDAEKLATLTAEHTTLLAQFGDQVRAFGVENPGSTAQVAEKLAQMGAQLPKTPGGRPSSAEHALSVLCRSEGQIGVLAGLVLDYRHSATVLGLFLAPYRQLVERGDGRARPTIYTMGADTGRMTSTRPNIQQLPRAGGIRGIFTADPGHVFISADFSGVELRGAAALSQDPSMRHMIAEEDAGRFDGFHWAVARQAYGPDASKADRYNAKRGVFGVMYGGGAAALSKQIGVTEQEMVAISDSLKTIAPGYFSWSERMRQAVRAGNTRYESCSGRVIHFDPAIPHKAPSYAVQGSCRELLIDALLRWRDTLWGDATIVPIHDELLVMVPAEDADEALTTLVAAMESDLYGVRIKAEPSVPSQFWRDAE